MVMGVGDDKGWAGSWEPMVLPSEVLGIIRDFCGAPVFGMTGKKIMQVTVNLATGEITYPPAGWKVRS